MTVQSREWLDADGCFKFGKYGGPNPASVEDVAIEDPSYLPLDLGKCRRY